MITYQNPKTLSKDVIGFLNLTNTTFLFSDFIIPIQSKLTQDNYFFNPSYWYIDSDGLYKLKKDIALFFNFINNTSNTSYEMVISFKKDNRFFYLYYDNGGLNRNENSFYTKQIFLPKDSYLCIQVGQDFTIGNRFYFGRTNIDIYNGVYIYLTI